MAIEFKNLNLKINNWLSYIVKFNVIVQEVLKLNVIVQGLYKLIHNGG